MVVFCLGLKVVMARGRRLKKSGGGELEINKQNVIALDEATIVPDAIVGDEAGAEPHVVASNATIVEQNIVALDAAIAQQNVIASDEAISDRSVIASDQEIGEQNGALSQLKHKDNNLVYIFLEFMDIKLNTDLKNYTSFLKFNYIRTFHHLLEGAGFFWSKFFYCNTWKQFLFIGVVCDCVILCFVIPAFCFLNSHFWV